MPHLFSKALFGVVFVLACAPLHGCDRQHGNRHHQAHNGRQADNSEQGGNSLQADKTETADQSQATGQTATEDLDNNRGRGRGRGLRRVCRDDLQKYCANEERGRQRRECLQTHLDQLSADCRTALQSRGERRHRR